MEKSESHSSGQEVTEWTLQKPTYSIPNKKYDIFEKSKSDHRTPHLTHSILTHNGENRQRKSVRTASDRVKIREIESNGRNMCLIVTGN